MDKTGGTGGQLILGICGSLSARSINKGLLQAATSVLPDAVSFEWGDIASLPHFDPDLQESEGDPPSVTVLKHQIERCTAILIAAPEYNFGIPGVLKNAIDWASRPAPSVLERKAVGIVSASPALPGGVRGQLQLRQNLLYTNTYVLPQPQFAVGLSRNKFNPDGSVHDEKTLRKLADYMQTLIAWAGVVAQVGIWPGTKPDERHVF